MAKKKKSKSKGYVSKGERRNVSRWVVRRGREEKTEADHIRNKLNWALNNTNTKEVEQICAERGWKLKRFAMGTAKDD